MICNIIRIPNTLVYVNFEDDSGRITQEYEVRFKKGEFVNKNKKEVTPIPAMWLIAEAIELQGVVIDFEGELREELEL